MVPSFPRCCRGCKWQHPPRGLVPSAAQRRGARGISTLGVSARRGGTRATQLDAQMGAEEPQHLRDSTAKETERRGQAERRQVCEGFSELSP